ncbi:MAG TPA: helix-turn-helix domain-containing protein [Candidatus Nanoarchaeia archaeon]|nr:helix-turn-helix domain-containing protein [Candidatus Nanoarchaeia archaeon]
MDAKLLEDIGLTEGETKVYLTLLELGTTTTGSIIQNSGISASKVYQILDRLAKKGLVGHVMISGIKHFRASEPKRILDYLTEKEQELAEKKQKIQNILPELLLKQQMSSGKRKAEIYEGLKGVTNLFKNILDELKRGESYWVIGAGYGFEEILGMRNFFLKYHGDRAKQGIKVFMLANHNVRKTLVPTTLQCSEVRFLPEDIITNVQLMFYKEKAFVILWSKEPVAFLIHNPEIVEGFHKYFKLLWKTAEK